jgi:hypothetical protein
VALREPRKTAVELAGEVISAAGGLHGSTTYQCTTRSTKGFEIEFRALLNEKSLKVELVLV